MSSATALCHLPDRRGREIRAEAEHRWPSGATNVGAVVDWLRENVIAYGGDLDRIFLMGQSAGANHVAT